MAGLVEAFMPTVIAAAIPNAQRATVSKAGHLPPLENPEEFADAILNWHSSVSWPK